MSFSSFNAQTYVKYPNTADKSRLWQSREFVILVATRAPSSERERGQLVRRIGTETFGLTELLRKF